MEIRAEEKSGDRMVLSARNDGRTARGTHEVRFGGGQAIQPSLGSLLRFEIQGVALVA